MPCQKCFQFWSDEVGKFWIKQSQAFFMRVGGWGWGRLPFVELLTLYCLELSTEMLSKCIEGYLRSRLCVEGSGFSHCYLLSYLCCSCLARTMDSALFSTPTITWKPLHLLFLLPGRVRSLLKWNFFTEAFLGHPTQSCNPRHDTLVPFHDLFFFLALVSLTFVFSVRWFIICVPPPPRTPRGCALYEELQAFRGLLVMPVGGWASESWEEMHASGIQLLQCGEEQSAAW